MTTYAIVSDTTILTIYIGQFNIVYSKPHKNCYLELLHTPSYTRRTAGYSNFCVGYTVHMFFLFINENTPKHNREQSKWWGIFNSYLEDVL